MFSDISVPPDVSREIQSLLFRREHTRRHLPRRFERRQEANDQQHQRGKCNFRDDGAPQPYRGAAVAAKSRHDPYQVDRADQQQRPDNRNLRRERAAVWRGERGELRYLRPRRCTRR